MLDTDSDGESSIIVSSRRWRGPRLQALQHLQQRDNRRNGSPDVVVRFSSVNAADTGFVVPDRLNLISSRGMDARGRIHVPGRTVEQYVDL